RRNPALEVRARRTRRIDPRGTVGCGRRTASATTVALSDHLAFLHVDSSRGRRCNLSVGCDRTVAPNAPPCCRGGRHCRDRCRTESPCLGGCGLRGSHSSALRPKRSRFSKGLCPICSRNAESRLCHKLSQNKFLVMDGARGLPMSG